MLGSKIRSWMENHIVRSRRKGNKNNNNNNNNNKNGQSSNLATSNTQNGHKGTSSVSSSIGQNVICTGTGAASATATSSMSHQNQHHHHPHNHHHQYYYPHETNPSAIGVCTSSPARRSEVSPIQSHTTSRAGWQSPQDDDSITISPKSDHYPYRHMVKSRTSSPHQIPRKSSYTLDNRPIKTAITTPSNTMGSITTDSTINNTTTVSMATSSTINNNSNSSNFHHHNSNKIIDNKNTPQSMTSTTTSQVNRSMFNESKTMENKNVSAIKMKNKTNTMTASTASGCYDDVSIKNGINYEKTNKNGNEATSVLNNNNNNSGGSSCTINSTYNNNNNNVKNGKLNQNIDDNHVEGVGYGKILARTNPIQAVTQHHSRHQLSKQQQQQQQFLHDQINANLMPATQITTNSNNNHLHPTQYIAQPCGGKNPIGYHPHQPAPRGRGLRGGPIISNGVTTSTQPSGRYHHVVNSLSSPESAYSTGYSTDGTSPGATYTPEYYINIRTGTHYFPKNVVHHPISMEPQSLAGLQTTTTTTSSVSRYKPFMLNKIDEATTPNGSGPNSTDLIGHFHRRTESCDLGKNFNPLIENLNNKNNNGDGGGTNNILIVKNSTQNIIYTPAAGMSPILQKNLSFQSYKGIESPSPRQRCRIRTNPWFSNAVAAAAAVGATTTDSSSSTNSNFLLSKKIELDTCSTSSGIKSSNSDAGIDDHLNKINHLSETESSSSTEREFSHKTKSSPNTMRRNKQTRSIMEASKSIAGNNGGNSNCNESDEDATLNEMMGKFDESYVYEKETDILSDSDPTDCASDLDTGQDAGDECDTDELLDIDFIDTGSIQEIIEKEGLQNTGSCSYHMIQQIVCEKRATSAASTSSQHRLARRSRRQDVEGGSKRRKKLVRTRKKGSTESGGQASHGANSVSGSNATTMSSTKSPILAIRGCRSVGGTPVCLRRNQSEDKSRQIMTPLINRANSLTFTEIHSIRSKFLSIAESEKALLKADLEADIKYKQLIHEAETILVSLKTNGLRDVSPMPVQSVVVAPIVAVGPPPPAISPRRICNLPTNKRVEMLRHCEVDLKREMGRNSTSNTNGTVNGSGVSTVGCTTSNNSSIVVKSAEIGATDLLNKRLEILRNETASAPNSPKPGSRFSPRKTHVSNFIIQNVSPTDLLRRKSVPAGDHNNQRRQDDTMSPQLQLNGRKIGPSPPKSPTPMRRRFRSQSPRVSIDSDSDSDAETKKKPVNKFHRRHFESNGNKENNVRQPKASSKRLPPPPPPPPLPPKPNKIIEDPIYDDIINENHKYDAKDFLNRNIIDNIKPKPPLISFRSIDIGNHNPESFYYCPQSEPLKRKIYTCSSTYDKIQKSLDMESEIPKKALLNKISLLRRERQAIKELTNASNEIMLSQYNNNNNNNNNHLNNNCIIESNNNYNNNNNDNDNNNNNVHNNNIINNNINNNRQSGYEMSNDNANSINVGEKLNNKHLLIMNTIEDIKRSLEDQSIELYGLNESDT